LSFVLPLLLSLMLRQEPVEMVAQGDREEPAAGVAILAVEAGQPEEMGRREGTPPQGIPLRGQPEVLVEADAEGEVRHQAGPRMRRIKAETMRVQASSKPI
jgi:hypothetical protein